MEQTNFIDSYTLKWTLRDEQGRVWSEELDEMSLSDFETVYGNNSNEILNIELRLIDRAK